MNQRQKWVIGCLIALAFMVISPVVATAEVEIKSAQILFTGINGSFNPPRILVRVVDQAAVPYFVGARTYRMSEELGNKGYATALTAFSMNKSVWLRVSNNAEAGETILHIYLSNE